MIKKRFHSLRTLRTERRFKFHEDIFVQTCIFLKFQSNPCLTLIFFVEKIQKKILHRLINCHHKVHFEFQKYNIEEMKHLSRE